MKDAAAHTGLNVSLSVHGALILWALVGGWFLQSRDQLEFSATDVSLFSTEEFQALFERPAPEVAETSPELASVVPDGPAPEVTAVEEIPVIPEPPAPPALSEPREETFDPPTPPLAPVVEEAPVAEETVIVNETFEAEATPVEAEKVTTEPSVQPEDDLPVAEETIAQTNPEEVAEPVAEPETASVEEATATEIVTEAETPSSSVMTASLRPMVRPTVAPTPEPEVQAAEEPEPDLIAAALAEVVSESDNAAPLPIGSRLSPGEENALRLAVKNCWNLGAASTEVMSTKVTVFVAMNQDGTPQNGSIQLMSHTGGSESSAKKAFEAARRAIIRCGASGYNLPIEKYDQWQNIEITFNPENMRTR